MIRMHRPEDYFLVFDWDEMPTFGTLFLIKCVNDYTSLDKK